MITIKSIKNVKYEDHDHVWAIVRSMKYQNPNITQVAALSPPQELFRKYLEWRDLGVWTHELFLEKYVPEFLTYIHEDYWAQRFLGALVEFDRAGKDICLVCFCPDETLCHRSIIAGLLQGMGCNVVTDTGNDYTSYFKFYIELSEKLDNDRKALISSQKDRKKGGKK